METELNEKQKMLSNLESDILKMERHTRSFNLRFGGIKENENEDTLNKLQDLIT